jgi:hypothetical protein
MERHSNHNLQRIEGEGVRWASHSPTINHWPRNAKAPYTPLGVKGQRDKEGERERTRRHNFCLNKKLVKNILYELQAKEVVLVFTEVRSNCREVPYGA